MTLNRANIGGMLRLLLAAGARSSRTPEKRCLVPALKNFRCSSSILHPSRYEPQTSLSRPPWPELPAFDPAEEAERHRALVRKVNGLLEEGESGRLFAVVHFASRQWKVTDEDLILIENHIDAACGDRIRIEKVLLVGGKDFTLVGKPLLSRDLVQVHATVIEKTQSWPMVHMSFWKRHRFQKKRIIVQPQTVLRINSVQVSPRLF
ncbi:39S ribosomal protein L21, mitochondrial [Puntigrus tetrazona]|uniref:39S ribosomal protein L21, mitochondrial n=1 Tax=Puntigrus tetrazona TaxID=1606681 RepID=UPI001C8A9942|nr:39S ribosomal protein L21, mitochondrial [Puntigrus tetrazona]